MQTSPISGRFEIEARSDDRSARVLAKTLYRELRQSGLEERQVLAVATELLGLVASELRDHG